MTQSVLVGDIGSTSGMWVYHNGSTSETLETQGFNPNSQNSGVIERMINAVAEFCPRASAVYYYGSGISNKEVATAVGEIIKGRIDTENCHVHSDLLGAARACCGDSDGVVAILGTGSNCAVFSNGQLTAGRPSLGYPLGDEGSGWRLGSALIKGYYYGEMPDELAEEFGQLLPDSRVDMLAYLRQSPTPNRYLASFATFASAHLADAWVSESVRSQLNEFIEAQIKPLRPEVPIHFVGGIAAAFEPVLKQLLEQSGLVCGRILNTPIQALVQYHLKR